MYEHLPHVLAVAESLSSKIQPLGIGHCALCKLPAYTDVRGKLMVAEFNIDLPFVPVRQFFVYQVDGAYERGDHAHKTCAQLLLAVHGRVSALIDDGEKACVVELMQPDVGLYIPPKIWGTQFEFKTDTVLSVYASESYDPQEYINSYAEFKSYIS